MPTTPTISLLEAFQELSDPRARECAYQLEELLRALDIKVGATFRPKRTTRESKPDAVW